MAITVDCPICKEKIIIDHEDIETLEDTHYATMNCSHCKTLLYSHEEKGIISFEDYMREENPELYESESVKNDTEGD